MTYSSLLFVKDDMVMLDLIPSNPRILLMLEHFGIDFVVQHKRINELCREYVINPPLFVAICNLYNGFSPVATHDLCAADIPVIVRFLRNSHAFYKQDKYPEILQLIRNLRESNNIELIALIEKFFLEYFDEVSEHLEYEEKIAFPYFIETDFLSSADQKKEFSGNEYREHHSDIELKLADLKNLLLKHVNLNNNLSNRRKLLVSLFELEFDLKIHSQIEQQVLVPLVERFEREGNSE